MNRQLMKQLIAFVVVLCFCVSSALLVDIASGEQQDPSGVSSQDSGVPQLIDPDRVFQVGVFSGRLINYVIQVNSPTIESIEHGRDDLEALLAEFVLELEESIFFKANFPAIMVSIKVDHTIVQTNTLLRSYQWRYTPELDAARAVCDPGDRIDTFQSTKLHYARMIELLHYGLFDQVREADPGRVMHLFHNYVLWAYSDLRPGFFSDRSRVIVLNHTTKTIDGYGNEVMPRSTNDFVVRVEPRSESLFKGAIEHMWGPVTFRVQEDSLRVIRRYQPESRILNRFLENLHRYESGLEPLKPQDDLTKPSYVIEGRLLDSEVLGINEFINDRCSGPGFMVSQSPLFTWEAQQAGLSGSVLKCRYVSGEQTIVRYFWVDTGSDEIALLGSSLSPGNPVLNDVGPEIPEAPAMLSDAIELITTNTY